MVKKEKVKKVKVKEETPEVVEEETPEKTPEIRGGLG